MILSTPNQAIAPRPIRGHFGYMLAERISENMWRVREAKGISRVQLGQRMDPPTSSQQIERLEKGERRLTVEWIERIAKGLGVDPAELIAGEDQQHTMTTEVAVEVALELARIVLQGGDLSSVIWKVLA